MHNELKTFTIRCYNCEDLDEVVSLWYRSWTNTFPNFKHPLPFKEWKSRFENEYAPSDVWVAATKERILGFMVASYGIITQIYVDVDIQRSGVGTALLNQAKKIYPDSRILNTVGMHETIQIARYIDNGILLRNVTNFRLLQKLACIKSDK